MKDLLVDKRRVQRTPIQVRVECSGAESFSGTTTNLTADGLYVETVHSLPADARLELAIHVPGGDAPVKAVGRVVRGAMDEYEWPGLGVEFTSVEEGGRARLVQFLHALERGRYSRDDAA